jgi:SAM-dependent methyltransferase
MKLKKGTLNLLKNWISLFGDPRKILALRYFSRYFSDWVSYRCLPDSEGLLLKDSFPCLADWTQYTPFDPHYFYQAVWLARHLAALKPPVHVDIGSSIATIAVTSAYLPTVFVDYRPLKVDVEGFFPVAGSVLSLPFGDGQLSSLSCLHVIEHIGLGRYGEPLDPMGTRLAALELARVLSPGGKLFLSMPVGRERTQFNAQRIFKPSSITDMFDMLHVDSFSLIDDDGHLIQSAEISRGDACEYGCGLFEMAK